MQLEDRTNSTAIDQADLPRLAWTAPSGYYRVVIVDSGLTSFANRAPELPYGTFYVVECRDGQDALGGERWRPMDRCGDQGRWVDVFRELAAAHGVFA